MRRFAVRTSAILLSAGALLVHAPSPSTAQPGVLRGGQIQYQARIDTRNGLRFRSAPRLSARSLGTIPHKTRVTVLGESGPARVVGGRHGRWTRIRWGRRTGWVFGGFLKREFTAPRVIIDGPANGWTALKYVIVRGRVLGDPGIRELRFTFNDNKRFIPVKPGGTFKQRVYLSPGANYIQVRARNEKGVGLASLKLMTGHGRTDMKLVLTWDTDRTYIDLYVTDPKGETVSFQNTRSKIGGVLTGSTIFGYGPQIFTLGSALPGEYSIRIKYYGTGPSKPVMAKVFILLYEGTPREKRLTFPALLHKKGDVLSIAKFNVR